MFLGAPTIAWAFLAVSLIGAVFTANAFVPVRRVPALFMPSFFGSWLTAELAAHHMSLAGLGYLCVLQAWRAGEAWPGWAGLIITFGSWLGLAVLFRGRQPGSKTLQAALRGLQAPPKMRSVPRRQVVLPFSSKRRRGVKVVRDIEFRRVAGTTLEARCGGACREGRKAARHHSDTRRLLDHGRQGRAGLAADVAPRCQRLGLLQPQLPPEPRRYISRPLDRPQGRARLGARARGSNGTSTPTSSRSPAARRAGISRRSWR